MRINNNIHNNVSFKGKKFDNLLIGLGNIKNKALDCDLLCFKEKNIAFPAYATMLMGVVIGSRYFQARDKDEKREVLTRDITTLLTYLFAVPILKKVISAISQHNTGFLTVFKKHVDKLDKANPPQLTAMSKLKGYLSRDNGFQLLSFEDIINTYVIKNNKFNDFCDLVIANTSETKDNLYKIFSFVMKKVDDKNSLDAELKKAGFFHNDNKQLSHDNTVIKDWITNLEKSNPDLFKKIQGAFGEKGKVYERALNLKAIPDLMAFGITVFLAGFFLPWINIKYTRRLYLNKTQNQQQPVNNTQPNNSSFGLTQEQKTVYEKFGK